jgi:2-hydroxychromene-2-carboxylate isomerase
MTLPGHYFVRCLCMTGIFPIWPWCVMWQPLMGLDADALSLAVAQPEVKARLKSETDAAILKGVFGAPFFMVNDEPFWGVDRLPQLEKWLATGGF